MRREHSCIIYKWYPSKCSICAINIDQVKNVAIEDNLSMQYTMKIGLKSHFKLYCLPQNHVIAQSLEPNATVSRDHAGKHVLKHE